MNLPTKRRWQRVDGVLLLDKPSGMTSNDALQKARRLFSAEKAGHTGTLDPLASGLLPLCFGEATKFANDLLDADKVYLAELRLGQTTDSGDADGVVIDERAVNVDSGRLHDVLRRFVGEIEQVPPMHSALKRDGVPLYKLARQGITVERAARRVTIHSIAMTRCVLPQLELRVACSKGTYIRTLAEDIGSTLGCGAHLTALRREGVGNLQLASAVTLEQLETLDDGARAAHLLPVDTLLSALPRIELAGEAALRFRNGNAVVSALGEGERFRVYAEERLLGVGIRDPRHMLQPLRLIRLDA